MGDFGVTTSNRFAALDLEAEQRKKSRPAKTGGAQTVTPSTKASVKSAAKNAPAAGAAVLVGDTSARDNRANKKPSSGQGRVRHGEKEGKGAAVAGAKGKRVFDKYSHSGKGQVPKEGKKSGGGNFNWGGKNKTQLEALANPTADESAAQPEQAQESTEPEAANAAASASPVEEEPSKLTYEEYLAQQKAVKASFRVRQAGEGEDPNAWSSFTPLQREEDLVSFGSVSKKAAKKAAKKDSTPKAEVVSADKLFKLTAGGEPKPRSERGGRGRGPRDGAASSSSPRGQGNRGSRGGRGGKSRGPTIPLDDQKAFPSLK